MSSVNIGEVPGLNESYSKQIKNDNTSVMLPLEVIDQSIGSEIRVLLSNNKEFQGTLVGFDDFVNVVLQDVVERGSDVDEKKVTRKMLLNGSQIAMLCPA